MKFIFCGAVKFEQLILPTIIPNLSLKTETRNPSDILFLMLFFISATLENSRSASALDIRNRSNFITPSARLTIGLELDEV